MSRKKVCLQIVAIERTQVFNQPLGEWFHNFNDCFSKFSTDIIPSYC